MKSFRKDICELVAEAHHYQYKEINKNEEANKLRKPRLYLTVYQWLIVLICIGILIIKKDGFSNEFSGYIISALSLFVGLFFTFIIVLYDKFKSIDFDKHKKDISITLNAQGKLMKNFFKKVTVLTLYAVLLSLLCIVLLSTSLLFPELGKELCYSNFFIKDIYCIDNIILMLKTIYRFFTYYFILDFLLITLYIISAFYDFLIGEYNKVKL